MKTARMLLAIALVCLACTAVAAQEVAQATAPATAPVVAAIAISADRENHVYAKGEEATFTIKLTEDGQPSDAAAIECELSENGFIQNEKLTVDLEGGVGTVTVSRDEPCFVWIRATYAPEGADAVNVTTAAGFSPEEIEPSMPEPDDFDEFWTAKIAEMDETPANPVIEPMEGAWEGLELYKVTLDGYGGTKIHGYLAKPEGDGPFPAMFQPQWAGVYSLQPAWALGHAKAGFICVNINAHAIENGKPDEFYRGQDQGALKGYAHQGRESRETNYFLRMFLSCVRATDYLAARPEWDGEHFLVSGGSQGGGQAFVTAALSPHVTAMSASVPALCDHTAAVVGRVPGWPRMAGWNRIDLTDEQLAETRYFDAVNFAKRVQVPALVGVGFADLTCSASSVYAAYNALPGDKQMAVDALAGHGGGHENFWGAVGPFTEKHKKD